MQAANDQLNGGRNDYTRNYARAFRPENYTRHESLHGHRSKQLHEALHALHAAGTTRTGGLYIDPRVCPRPTFKIIGPLTLPW